MKVLDETVFRAPRPRPLPKRTGKKTISAVAGTEPVVIDPRFAELPFTERLAKWFDLQGWQPMDFQREVWREIANGASGLLHATTGSGKTLAVWLGALAQFAPHYPARSPSPLTVLWITPMRALAADTGRALHLAVNQLGVPWNIGLRTSDTSLAERTRQNRRMPSALITTPESLSLRLTHANAQQEFASLRLVVVDEWHELLGNKRGTQTQLALARLARWSPGLQVWGLSATLNDLDLAQAVLLSSINTPKINIGGQQPKSLVVDTLIPAVIERFPWSGHLGLRQVAPVVEQIEQAHSCLLFTNTRSQSEHWYQAILQQRPDWAGLIAIHHGSLDKKVRQWVELGLKNAQLKAVVCTSSLDLGVDFLPVERVFQMGSPKGIARLIQRAGRSGHSPGRTSRITLVPTHALELIEAAAIRNAIKEKKIESRFIPYQPFDVLVQHLVSIAIGGGFKADALFNEIKTTFAYRELTRAEFDRVLNFVESGGPSLSAYPDYHRLQQDENNQYHMLRKDLIRRHRHNIGTIISNAMIQVVFISGGRIGTVEESFISRLKPGDIFTFAGRTLEFVRVREMIAYVKRAASTRGVLPKWTGSNLPLSSELASHVLSLLGQAAKGHYDEPEMQAIRPLLALQAKWSALPEPGILLMESIRSREGYHLFCYPFAGQLAHMGCSALLAWRVAREHPHTFSISINDYGFELLSEQAIDWHAKIDQGLFACHNVQKDLLASLNATEIVARRFREIARIAGLVFQGPPGQQKSARQLQASSGLFYEIFRQHDPKHLLLTQAQSEVLSHELDFKRLYTTLEQINLSQIVFTRPKKPTPFAFPLMVARLREKMSTEKLADRVQRMLLELEKIAQ